VCVFDDDEEDVEDWADAAGAGVAVAAGAAVLFEVAEGACFGVDAAAAVVAPVEVSARARSLLLLSSPACIKLSKGRKPRKLAETIAERR
jgi:hypothetical protein